MTSLRNIQLIESKAFEKSTLTSMVGLFKAATWLRISRVAMKFSAMNLPFMKAVWCGLIKEASLGLNRFANNLDMIFGNRLMMLIGLNSVTNIAFSVFRIMTIFARLIVVRSIWWL